MIEAAKWVYGSAAVAAVLVASAAIWYRAGRSVREARRVAAIARRDYRKNGYPVQEGPLPPAPKWAVWDEDLEVELSPAEVAMMRRGFVPVPRKHTSAHSPAEPEVEGE